jgi:hypothetical protein
MAGSRVEGPKRQLVSSCDQYRTEIDRRQAKEAGHQSFQQRHPTECTHHFPDLGLPHEAIPNARSMHKARLGILSDNSTRDLQERSFLNPSITPLGLVIQLEE